MSSTSIVYVTRNKAQRLARDLYRTCDVLLLQGPAGGGKTHAALGLALTDLFQSRVAKVMLSRPMIGCDEELGFMPGSLREKVEPWLGAFKDVIPNLTFAKGLLEDQRIEVAPLALLRGRTVSNAILVVDEAQNCTMGQIRMILTRLGKDGKMILCGDPQQSDLNSRAFSVACKRLRGLPGVGVVSFPAADNLRHPLIPMMLERLA